MGLDDLLSEMHPQACARATVAALAETLENAAEFLGRDANTCVLYLQPNIKSG